MTLKKKRKYGDLASQTASNNSNPDLIADVYAAFTGRRPQVEAPVDESGADSTTAPVGKSEAVKEMPQPRTLAAAARESAPDILSRAVNLSGAANLSKLLPEGPIYDKWTPTPNDITDLIQPLIKPQDFAVLTRLYRLAQGFQTNTVRVSNPRLAKACNVSERDLRRILGRLVQHSLITRLDTDFSNSVQAERGMVIQVNLPVVEIKNKDNRAGAVNLSGAVSMSAPDKLAPNKNTHIKELHTNTDAVRVSSRFSLEECRRYATHLQNSGQGITNPGGFATTIHRSGEADEQIAAFLSPPPASLSLDASQCPDCNGTGWWYPEGVEKGTARCKHTRLTAAS